MKALVIGGTRFFGKHLVQSLLQDGIQVTILSRGNVDDGFNDKVQRIKANRQQHDELSRAVDGQSWDLIFDQICYTAQEARDACRIFSAKTPRYIVTSSESVYGDGLDQKESRFDPRSHQFDKDAGKDQDYAEAKRQVEAVFAKNAEMDVVMVRPSIVVGVDDYTGRLKWHIDRILADLPIYFPNVNSKINFIRSDHAGVALKTIGLSNHVGPINCTASDPMALNDLMTLCEEVVGKSLIPQIEATDESHSPYGVGADWSMDVSALQSLGFRGEPPSVWMRDLICQIARLPIHERAT